MHTHVCELKVNIFCFIVRLQQERYKISTLQCFISEYICTPGKEYSDEAECTFICAMKKNRNVYEMICLLTELYYSIRAGNIVFIYIFFWIRFRPALKSRGNCTA